jgi:deoxyadenosine/deoxycytidine kinase
MKYLAVNSENYINKGEKNMAIIVDGIIGAGKSTVASFLSEKLDIKLYQEILEDHSESLTQRMLDRFYENQSRWSAITQVMFLNHRFKDLKRIEKEGDQGILDRSIYGDEIFAKTIYQRGQMLEDELVIYQELLSNMLEHIKVPELLIYLDVSVETALERIRKRSRSTEGEMIPRDYLIDLKRNYEEWYDAFDLCPKVRINLDAKGVLDVAKKESILKSIRKYIVVKK